MPEQKKHKIGIVLEDGCVELRLGESVIKVELDECGLPEFPESVKEQLPPYVPEMVEKLMTNVNRHQQNQSPISIAVDHEVGCAETAGLGRCNCNPILGDPEMGSWGDRLTCSMCEESSTGEINCHVVELLGKRWERLWTNGADRFYWILEEDKSKTILCEDCLRYVMTKLGVEFPNVVRYDNVD